MLNIRDLVIKIADLSQDAKCCYPEEIGVVNAAFWYIFSNNGGWRLSRIVNQEEWPFYAPITKKQQINLIEYSGYFRDIAMALGLLSEYDETIANLKPVEPKALRNIKNWLRSGLYSAWVCSIVIILATNLLIFKLGVVLLPLLFGLDIAIEKIFDGKPEPIKILKKQNDFIIKQVNKHNIGKKVLEYRARLIVLGWIATPLPKNFTQEFLENSKRYWTHGGDFWRNHEPLTDEDINGLSKICNRVQEDIALGKCDLRLLVDALREIDGIVDNPFAGAATIELRNQSREFFINKLREALLANAELTSIFNKAMTINSVYRKVHFDQDRVGAYKMYLGGSEHNYASFIQQLLEWSKSDEGMQQLAKFAVPSSIELHALSNFVDDPVIFEELSYSIVLKALNALLGGIITETEINWYLDARFQVLVESCEGRKQIIKDVLSLHEIHMLYMKIMLNSIQNDDGLRGNEREERHKLQVEINRIIQRVLGQANALADK